MITSEPTERSCILPSKEFLNEDWLVSLCIDNEGVLKQIPRGASLDGVLDQTAAHKVSEMFAPSAADLRRLIVADVVQDFCLGFIDIWRFSLGQLKGENSKGPNVNLEVVCTVP